MEEEKLQIPNALLIIDGNYAKRTFQDFGKRLDYGKLLAWMETMNLPDPDENIVFGSHKYYMDSGKSQSFIRYLHSQGFQTPELKSKNKDFYCKKCKTKNSCLVQANVDIEIALTLLEQGIQKDYINYIFLFSGDGDFLRVVDKIKNSRVVKHFFLIGASNSTNQELRTRAEMHLRIDDGRAEALSMEPLGKKQNQRRHKSPSRNKPQPKKSPSKKPKKKKNNFYQLGDSVEVLTNKKKDTWTLGLVADVEDTALVVQIIVKGRPTDFRVEKNCVKYEMRRPAEPEPEPQPEPELQLEPEPEPELQLEPEPEPEAQPEEDEKVAEEEKYDEGLGDFYDVRDYRGKWNRAEVLRKEGSRIYVHYLDFPSKYDQWLDLDNEEESERVAEFVSMTSSDREDSRFAMGTKVYNKLPTEDVYTEGEVMRIDGSQVLVTYQDGDTKKSYWYHVQEDGIFVA